MIHWYYGLLAALFALIARDVRDAAKRVREWESNSHSAQSTGSEPDMDQLVIDIARELYDRFMMGGWEPQDSHALIRCMLTEAGIQPLSEQDSDDLMRGRITRMVREENEHNSARGMSAGRL